MANACNLGWSVILRCIQLRIQLGSNSSIFQTHVLHVQERSADEINSARALGHLAGAEK